MKKKKRGAGAVPVAIIAALALLLGVGPGLGFGPGGSGEGIDGNIAVTAPSQEAVLPETTAETEPSEEEKFILTVAVSVLENGYIYENRSVTLDEFLEELASLEEEFIVEVTDENASLKAYKSLTDALTDRGIAYTEK